MLFERKPREGNGKPLSIEEKWAAVLLFKSLRQNGDHITQKSESLASSLGVSTASLRRWECAYDAKGILGLQRQGRSDKGESRTTCPWAIRFIKRRKNESTSCIYNALKTESSKRGKAFCTICEYNADKKNPCKLAGNGITVPKKATIKDRKRR